MQVTQKYYLDLFNDFYAKSIAKHPKKSYLLQMKQKKMNLIKQEKISRQKDMIRNSKVLSPDHLKKSTASNQSRKISTVSSDDSRHSKVRIKLDEYFKCQWVYNSGSFIKSLMYGYLILTARADNSQLLKYLRQKFLEEYHDFFNQAEIHSIDFYWDNIIRISDKKQKLWQKQFQNSFKHFPLEFCNKLFQLTVKMNSQSINLGKLTSDTIKKISQSLGYRINYFHIHKKFIRTEVSQGAQLNLSVNVVYVQQLQRFMVSDRPLQKPSQDESSQKIKQSMGENINKLLKKFNQDNLILTRLQSLQQYSQQKGPSSKQKVRDPVRDQIRKLQLS